MSTGRRIKPSQTVFAILLSILKRYPQEVFRVTANGCVFAGDSVFFSCSYSSWEFCKHSLWFPSRTRSQAGNCHPRGPTEHQALDSNFGGESSVRAPLALRCTIEQRLAIHTPF